MFRRDEALFLGIKLHEKGCFDEAASVYRRILACAPDSPDSIDALHFLAVLCHQRDANDEALALVDRIVSLRPDLPDAHNNRGNVLKELGRPEEAEAAYRRAIALQPEHAAAHNNLGVVLQGLGRLEEAIEACRSAAALAPANPDFPYNLGNALRRHSRLPEAAEAYRKAVALLPGHAQARQGLARTLLQLGRHAEAAEMLEQWLEAEPGDPVAQHLFAAYGGRAAPARAPDAYVRQVFDEMAESFDAHLSGLGYRAPELVAEALAGVLRGASGLLRVLDAGCGTGLCGPSLRPHAECLTGVDLSARMLTKAARRGVYDELVEGELTAFLGQRPAAFDVIASADTLCYFGDLGPVFRCAAAALRPGGVFAFTLEYGGEELPAPGYRLHPHGRFSHSRRHVEQAVVAAGLTVGPISTAVLRTEGGQPVAGLVGVVKAQGGAPAPRNP
ncbi:MAG: tetratricopeptide repeat protein [Deltaproteobacteria bacterium]|nr:tetratricopeptide repeat protein [Deltaproteobacteria bacterium]